MARNIDELAVFIRNLGKGIDQAIFKALLATSVAAKAAAVGNASKNFTGRWGYTQGGQLQNSIFSELDDGQGRYPDVVLGTRGIPYGRLQEEGSDGLPGGVIVPQKAKHLWLPNYSKAGKMTPREFVQLMKAQPRNYFIKGKVAGRKDARSFTPLFFLKDSVHVPGRPYLRPAMELAFNKFSSYMDKYSGEVDA